MDQTKRELEWLEGFFLKAFCEGPESFFYPQHLTFAVEGTVSVDPIPFRKLAAREWRPFNEGDQWGENWDSGWFRLTATVPPEWKGREVVARLNFGGEACVFSAAGEPLQGLTGGSVNLTPFERDLFRLLPACKGGERIEILVEAAANELWGVPKGDVPVTPTAGAAPVKCGPVGMLKHVWLATFDEAMYQLWFDLTVLYRLMKDLPERDPMRARIAEGIHRARIDWRYNAPDAKAARRTLAPLFALTASGAEPATICVGHAHIDTAWLWPMRESIRKCCRTFSTQLGHMERYPDYVFGASQAPHYQFIKENYPGLYNRIKAAVAAGRWEIQGAMWVEADCNVPCGESLVRQLLYGKLFFREEFGVDVKNAWLPDVFGYTAALPQLFRQAGVDWFVTQKMSWNTVNRFPHHTFNWQGIDGSRVMTHLLPLENYNAQLFPDMNRFAARNHEERGSIPEFLTCFGIGNGGGGASDKHIEFGLRQRNLAGCPRVKFGTAQSQLDRLEASAASFKTWDGPLYLERHQGTMTTQAQMKRRNRRLEERLRELELRFAVSKETYPRKILRECWQTLLTNQFHDILPGSSITCVYQEAHATYTEIESRLDRLEAGLPAGSSVLFNPHSTDFCGVIENDNGRWIAVEARALSTTAVAPAKISDAVSVTASLLENELVRYTFNHDGRLLSAYDKTLEREFMIPGESGNCLSLYQDQFGDAWDTDKAVLEQRLSQAVSTTAPAVRAFGLAGEIEFTLRVGLSTVRQVVRLRALSRRLDFITTVTWQEERKQLRVSFPLDLRAREAKAEIQFGLQAYSLTENTAWDRAQSDVPAQRFADISEGNCGVALLNDSKYGVHLKGRTIDLNLLRSSLYPDETADRGEHTFTYALLPHAGCLEESDVLHEARLLNQPVRQVRMAEVALPFTFTSSSVVLETIKRAEESDDLVLRLYEPHGRRGRVTLCGNNLSFHESNLLEEAGAAMEMTDGCAQFSLRPFEVKTVLCRV